MLERRSALTSTLGKGGRDGADRTRRLKLGELRGWSLIQVAGFMPLEQILSEALGSGLPAEVGKAVAAGERLLLKTGPDQFWILGPAADEIAARLQQAMSPSVGSVTPLSHSRTRIFIEGAAAPEVLAKGIALDFHPQVFRVGQFALTGLHHTPVLVLRAAEDRYEIFAMRSFALSVWEWLTDAALPLGYDVVT
jgi:heterotetrameric sarcosine oxidase gamma subunit